MQVLADAVFLVLAFLALGVNAAPHTRAVAPVSPSQIASLVPYIQLARSTYCSADQLEAWDCNDACNAVPDCANPFYPYVVLSTHGAPVVPSLVGGNGDSLQNFFVGYWPSTDSIVVAHEGTDPTKFLSVLTDVEFVLEPLNTTLFPGVPSTVSAHDGFLAEHALTAPQILAEVRELMQLHATTTVTLIGHSLGGALAELDAVFLSLNLPSSTSISVVTFGKPRVGNPAFALLVDQLVPNFQRVNNEKDIVPILPGRGLGFQHPHGEIHLLSSGDAVACPGDDDATDAQCQIMTVPNILEGNILNHLGPYNDIFIGTLFCT